MPRIYKICLFIALFLLSASVAWAGFNYDSAHNYFLIDSILKTGGSYILVGDAFAEKADTFAVSNNLIFSATGQFTSGSRQMSQNNFSTPSIKVQSSNPFTISTRDLNKNLILGTNTAGNGINIKMDNNLVLDSRGLTLIDLDNPAANTIYAPEVLTKSLVSLTGRPLEIGNLSTLTVASGISNVSASSIIMDGQPFCQKVTWAPTDTANSTADVTNNGVPTGGDASNDNCATNTGHSAQKACCPANYYIYNFSTAGKLVCCRAR